MKDKSQASVGTHLICDAIFNNHSTTAGEGIFKITERLVKLVKKVDCVMHSVHLATVWLKDAETCHRS